MWELRVYQGNRLDLGGYTCIYTLYQYVLRGAEGAHTICSAVDICHTINVHSESRTIQF